MIDRRHRIISRIPGFGIIQEIADERFKKIVKNSEWSLAANVGSSVLGVIQTILFGRFLGADGFGVLALIIAYVTIVNQFVDFRVWETTTKYLSDYWIRGDKERAVATIKLSYLIDLLSGVVAFLIVILGLPIASRFVFSKSVASELVVLFALSLLFATVDNTGRAILRVFDRFKMLSLWQTAASLVSLITVAAVLLAGWGLEGVLIAYSVSALASALGLLLLVSRVVRVVVDDPSGSIALLRGRYKEIARFLFHTNMGAFWGAIIRNLDVILLGHFWGVREIGYFKMAKTFVSKLAMLTDPLYQALFPELNKMWATGDILAYNRFIKKLTIVAGSLFVVGALMFSILAPWAVRMTVGEEFLPSVAAIRIMIWGIVIAVTFIWARPTVIAMGKPEIGNWAAGFDAVLFVTISLVLVSRLGYIGSAMMFVLSYLLSHMVYLGAYCLELLRGPQPASS